MATDATDITYALLDEAQARAYLPDLIALLRDAVDGGASVGFLPPLEEGIAVDYWEGVLAGLAAGSRLLIAALADDHLVGEVQLELASKPNAVHRAEVQKLLVLEAYRQHGIGRALMERIQQQARTVGRRLLVLDTIEGSVAEGLYRRLGFTRAGVIPEYALNGDGGADPTVVFYKLLDE